MPGILSVADASDSRARAREPEPDAALGEGKDEGEGEPMRERGARASVEEPLRLLPRAVGPSLELTLSPAAADKGPRRELPARSPNGSFGSGDVGVMRVLPMRM